MSAGAVTGVTDDGKGSYPIPVQKKHFDAGALEPPSRQREADIKLRSSYSRFHKPVPAGAVAPVTAPWRSDMLAREGMTQPIKYSSCLGVGRSEIESQGVSDNFGNSYYRK